MLKLKDDVKFNELKKYGFERYQYFYKSFEYKCWGVCIDEHTRKVSVNHNPVLELLYDLIKADLIEKVEDK